MNKFPRSIPLPWIVLQKRLERRRLMTLSARKSILLRGCTILAELIGCIYFNSFTLLFDALFNFVDVASSFSLIYCIRKADRPPDKEHPFGHGRLEPIAGLCLAFLLIMLGIAMIVGQIFSISKDSSSTLIPSYTWLIPFIAVVMLEICYQIMKKTAKSQNSPALMADAYHYRLDALSSSFATIALLFAASFPKYSGLFDHLGALIIAITMLTVGVLASRNNLRQLLDHVPEPIFFEKVRKAAMQVEGVLATEKLRIQVYGPDAQVAIDIEVSPELSVFQAHEITQKVRWQIQKAWPQVRDVIVHVEPYYQGDH